jgi:hypothetical protein
VRELEAAILSGNRQAEHADAAEFSDYVVADSFFFVDLRRIDEPALVHAVDLGGETTDEGGLAGMAPVE